MSTADLDCRFAQMCIYLSWKGLDMRKVMSEPKKCSAIHTELVNLMGQDISVPQYHTSFISIFKQMWERYEKIRLIKQDTGEFATICNRFSPMVWIKLTRVERSSHQLYSRPCYACIQHDLTSYNASLSRSTLVFVPNSSPSPMTSRHNAVQSMTSRHRPAQTVLSSAGQSESTPNVVIKPEIISVEECEEMKPKPQIGDEEDLLAQLKRLIKPSIGEARHNLDTAAASADVCSNIVVNSVSTVPAAERQSAVAADPLEDETVHRELMKTLRGLPTQTLDKVMKILAESKSYLESEEAQKDATTATDNSMLYQPTYHRSPPTPHVAPPPPYPGNPASPPHYNTRSLPPYPPHLQNYRAKHRMPTAYKNIAPSQNIAVVPIHNHAGSIKLPDLSKVPQNTHWIVHCCKEMFDCNVGAPIDFNSIALHIEVPRVKQDRKLTLKHLANLIGLQTKQINHQDIVAGFPMFKNTPDFTTAFAKQIADVTVHQCCTDFIRTDRETRENRALTVALADVIMQGRDIHRDTPTMTLAKVVMVQPGSVQNLLPSSTASTVYPPKEGRKRRKVQSTSSSGSSPKPALDGSSLRPVTSAGSIPNMKFPTIDLSCVASRHQANHGNTLPPLKSLSSAPVIDISDDRPQQRSRVIRKSDMIEKSALEQLIFSISDKTLGLVETECDLTFNKVANLTAQTTDDFWKNGGKLVSCQNQGLDDGPQYQEDPVDMPTNGNRVTEFYGRLETADVVEKEDLSLSGDDINYKDHMCQIFSQIEQDASYLEKIEKLYRDKLNAQVQRLFLECPDLDVIARRQMLLFYSTLTHEILTTAALLGVVSFVTTLLLDQDVKEAVLNESIETIHSSDRMFLCGLVSCLTHPDHVNITLPHQNKEIMEENSSDKDNIKLGYLDIFNKLATKHAL